MSFLTPVLVIIIAIVSVVTGLKDLPVNTQIRVIGGQQASLGEFPWQAWIEGVKFFIFTTGCGGSLVTTKHIITAAHCVQGIQFYRVKLGAVNRFTNQAFITQLPGNRARAHPGYSGPNYAHDIAVISLMERIFPSAFIQPIKLPEPWEIGEYLDGKEALISGFGKTTDAESTAHPTLQYARVRILEHTLCSQFYKRYFEVLIEGAQLCTIYSSGLADVCSGDSGGPLVTTGSTGVPTLVGVISLGIEPCESGAPAVYTAVAAYLPWINEIVYGTG